MPPRSELSFPDLQHLDAIHYKHQLEAINHLSVDGSNLLEIGPGAGQFCRMLSVFRPEWSWTGLDNDLEVCKTLDAIYCDAEDLPFPDNFFSAVVMLCTIQWLSDPQKALKEIYDVLEPGGTFLLGVPFPDPAAEHILEHSYPVRYITMPEVLYWTRRFIIKDIKKSNLSNGHYCLFVLQKGFKP